MLVKIIMKVLSNLLGNNSKIKYTEIGVQKDNEILNIKEYVDSGEVYSTSEVKTNKVWIDDKPIYRKLITTTMPNVNNQWTAVASDITGIDNITKLNGIIVGGDGRKIPIPYYESTSYYYSLSFQPNTNQIQIYGNGASAFGGKRLYIVIEYTKTTD